MLVLTIIEMGPSTLLRKTLASSATINSEGNLS
jgi:hypothetical protein